MSFKFTLAGALGAALIVVSGATSAVEGAGDCTGAAIKADIEILNALFKPAIKYCEKGPDAALAAKLGEKIAKKANKAIAKFNNRVVKEDCATNADPDNPVSPIMGSFTPADGVASLQDVDAICDGIMTPP